MFSFSCILSEGRSDAFSLLFAPLQFSFSLPLPLLVMWSQAPPPPVWPRGCCWFSPVHGRWTVPGSQQGPRLSFPWLAICLTCHCSSPRVSLLSGLAPLLFQSCVWSGKRTQPLAPGRTRHEAGAEAHTARPLLAHSLVVPGSWGCGDSS